jgi:hypothetical protein
MMKGIRPQSLPAGGPAEKSVGSFPGPNIFDSKADIKKTLGGAQGAAMFA